MCKLYSAHKLKQFLFEMFCVHQLQIYQLQQSLQELAWSAGAFRTHPAEGRPTLQNLDLPPRRAEPTYHQDLMPDLLSLVTPTTSLFLEARASQMGIQME